MMKLTNVYFDLNLINLFVNIRLIQLVFNTCLFRVMIIIIYLNVFLFFRYDYVYLSRTYVFASMSQRKFLHIVHYCIIRIIICIIISSHDRYFVIVRFNLFACWNVFYYAITFSSYCYRLCFKLHMKKSDTRDMQFLQIN